MAPMNQSFLQFLIVWDTKKTANVVWFNWISSVKVGFSKFTKPEKKNKFNNYKKTKHNYDNLYMVRLTKWYFLNVCSFVIVSNFISRLNFNFDIFVLYFHFFLLKTSISISVGLFWTFCFSIALLVLLHFWIVDSVFHFNCLGCCWCCKSICSAQNRTLFQKSKFWRETHTHIHKYTYRHLHTYAHTRIHAYRCTKFKFNKKKLKLNKMPTSSKNRIRKFVSNRRKLNRAKGIVFETFFFIFFLSTF